VPTLRYVIADVFTDTPLEGNPLAVFTDGRELDAETMQRLAKETNLSETVFVLPAEGEGNARIRIFTPNAELRFAGHPTLGSAFVLGGPLQSDAIALETGSGLVNVSLERDQSGRLVFGRMSQPIPTWEPFTPLDELFAALRTDRATLPVELYDNGVPHAFIGLASVEELVALQPDFAALAQLMGIRGAYCFAPDGERWKARLFCPGAGITEDPATGSAAGPLAVHLSRHGVVPFGQEIEISQGAEIRRPSRLFARADGSAERIDRVEVGGSAVLVARGEFRLPG
jgi:trans-2,3-dihydro-3-hydroxyanthranilate isomerase